MPGGCYDLSMFSNSNNNFIMFLYNDGDNSITDQDIKEM